MFIKNVCVKGIPQVFNRRVSGCTGSRCQLFSFKWSILYIMFFLILAKFSDHFITSICVLRSTVSVLFYTFFFANLYICSVFEKIEHLQNQKNIERNCLLGLIVCGKYLIFSSKKTSISTKKMY